MVRLHATRHDKHEMCAFEFMCAEFGIRQRARPRNNNVQDVTHKTHVLLLWTNPFAFSLLSRLIKRWKPRAYLAVAVCIVLADRYINLGVKFSACLFCQIFGLFGRRTRARTTNIHTYTYIIRSVVRVSRQIIPIVLQVIIIQPARRFMRTIKHAQQNTAPVLVDTAERMGRRVERMMEVMKGWRFDHVWIKKNNVGMRCVTH